MSYWRGQVVPFPDELMSSWIVRLARRIARTPYKLLHFALGSYWWFCRDLDLFIGTQTIAKLAEFAGLDASALERHRLSVISSRKSQGVTPGILAAGVYHRKRRRHGLQYCPQCLLEQADPHFLMEWRFAPQFGCPVHGVHLRDACTTCGAAAIPHRRIDSDLVRCTECNSPLTEPSSSLSDAGLAACGWVHQLYTSGTARIAGRQVDRSEVIRGLQLLFGFVAGFRAPGAFLDHLDSPSTRRASRSKYDAMETSRVDVRAWAIPICVSLLEEWPGRFVGLCNEFGISRNRVHDDRREQLPGWYLEGVDALPRVIRRRRRPSKRRRARRRFQKVPLFGASLSKLDASAFFLRTVAAADCRMAR